MAISVDKIFKQVSVIINKEDRDVLTPGEFNALARRAQLEVFENTIHDYQTAINKIQASQQPAYDLELLKEKVAVFRKAGEEIGVTGSLPTDLYLLERVYDGLENRTIEITFSAGSNLVDEGSLSPSSIVLSAIYTDNSQNWENANSGEGNYLIEFDSNATEGNSDRWTFNNATGLVLMGSSMNTYTAAQVALKFKDYLNVGSPYHSAQIKPGSSNVVILTYNQSGISGASEFVNNYAGTSISATTPVTEAVTYDEVDIKDWAYMVSSKKLKPTTARRGLFRRKSESVIEVIPNPGKSIMCDYISTPVDPEWAGVNAAGNYFKYSSGNSTDFTLHKGDESSLVNRILNLAGVSISSPGVSQAAVQSEQLNEAEKNN